MVVYSSNSERRPSVAHISVDCFDMLLSCAAPNAASIIAEDFADSKFPTSTHRVQPVQSSGPVSFWTSTVPVDTVFTFATVPLAAGFYDVEVFGVSGPQAALLQWRLHDSSSAFSRVDVVCQQDWDTELESKTVESKRFRLPVHRSGNYNISCKVLQPVDTRAGQFVVGIEKIIGRFSKADKLDHPADMKARFVS